MYLVAVRIPYAETNEIFAFPTKEQAEGFIEDLKKEDPDVETAIAEG